jgi:hypothetical protein
MIISISKASAKDGKYKSIREFLVGEKELQIYF